MGGDTVVLLGRNRSTCEGDGLLFPNRERMIKRAEITPIVGMVRSRGHEVETRVHYRIGHLVGGVEAGITRRPQLVSADVGLLVDVSQVGGLDIGFHVLEQGSVVVFPVVFRAGLLVGVISDGLVGEVVAHGDEGNDRRIG